MTLLDRGPVLGSSPDLQCGGLAVVQVFQESTPDFISACTLLNQGVWHEVLNLPHEAGDEHTSDLISTEMKDQRSRHKIGLAATPRLRLGVLQRNCTGLGSLSPTRFTKQKRLRAWSCTRSSC